MLSNILAPCIFQFESSIFHFESSTSKSISTHSRYYQTLSRTGIARWPYRKMKSLEKKRQSLRAVVGPDAGIFIDFAQFSSSAASTPSTSQAHSPSPATCHSQVDESSLILAVRSNGCDVRDLKGAARKQQAQLEFRASESLTSRHWSVPLSLPENGSAML
jgi:hypothetical protein